MAQLTERVTKHGIWAQLNQLGPVIDQALARDDVGETEIEGLERMRAVLALVGKRLAAADPFTTLPANLDGINAAFQNATGELQAFVGNGSPGHITNANTHADTALANLAQVSVPALPAELEELRTAAVSYRETLQEQVKRALNVSQGLESGTVGLRDAIQEIGNQISTEKQRLSQLASDFQSQFSTAQEGRVRDFTEAEKTRQIGSSDLLKEYADDLAEQTSKFESERAEAVASYRESVDALKLKYGEQATLLLKEMEDHRARVEKLVGVIGNLGVTSGYLKVAERARKTTYLWQGGTVVALIGLVFFGWHAFLPVMQVDGPFNWAAFASRALLTLTVGVLAAYAANQGDKAQEMERRNRRMALELEAVGPFLAPLQKEHQDQFLLALGERSFGRDESTLGRGRGEKSPASVIDLVESKPIRELLSELVGAAVKGTRP